MRVLVVGAYGLIGGHVVTRLLQAGHQITGMGRDVATVARQRPDVRWITLDMARATPDQWAQALHGADAVVNCAGALQDGARDDLAAVHGAGLERLAQACARAGVRRFVQISASTIDAGTEVFSASKRAGDAVLAASGLDWIILRPGLVLAHAVYGGSALLRGLAAYPGVIPAVHAGAQVQVVAVEDVAEAVARCLEPDAPLHATLDLVGAERHTLSHLLSRLRGWLGLPAAKVLALPGWAARITAAGADALAWLGWRSPMRSTAMSQLAGGVGGRSGDAERLGLELQSLDAMLGRWPASVQDRWHARLYFMKPLTLAALSAFWLTSGAIGLIVRDTAALTLTEAGMGAELAMACVVGGGIADIALGLAVLKRRWAPTALKGMILVTAAYLAGATLWRPDLWADPLGPLVKTIPAAVLALCALAMMDER